MKGNGGVSVGESVSENASADYSLLVVKTCKICSNLTLEGYTI